LLCVETFRYIHNSKGSIVFSSQL